MNALEDSTFDNPKKEREWHTAFYYLAEHLRVLSDGAINHKSFYSLVGMEGRFVNSEKSRVRKSYAGMLSKLVHSKDYAADMRKRYLENALSFDDAAREICALILGVGEYDRQGLSEYWAHRCWPDVWRGLNNEKLEWRGTLDLTRIGQEAKYIFGEAAGAAPGYVAQLPSCEGQLSAMLRLISFGFIDVPYVPAKGTIESISIPKTLDARTQSLVAGNSSTPLRTCLVRYADRECREVIDLYLTPVDRPFTIGRATDRDAIESGATVSAHHGCLFCLDGVWYYEDEGSLNGSAIVRGGVVFELSCRNEPMRMALQFGDIISIAGISYYRFDAYRGHSIPPYVG